MYIRSTAFPFIMWKLIIMSVSRVKYHIDWNGACLCKQAIYRAIHVRVRAHMLHSFLDTTPTILTWIQSQNKKVDIELIICVHQNSRFVHCLHMKMSTTFNACLQAKRFSFFHVTTKIDTANFLIRKKMDRIGVSIDEEIKSAESDTNKGEICFEIQSNVEFKDWLFDDEQGKQMAISKTWINTYLYFPFTILCQWYFSFLLFSLLLLLVPTFIRALYGIHSEFECCSLSLVRSTWRPLGIHFLLLRSPLLPAAAVLFLCTNKKL